MCHQFSYVATGLLVFCLPAEAHYTITIDPKRPAIASASLDMSVSRGVERTLVARGTEWGLESQVVGPRCGDRRLSRAGKAAWKVPPDCMRVNWTVRFASARPWKVDASEQKSVHFPGPHWWLLSEPTALLRVQGDEAPSTLSIAFVGPAMPQLGATSAGGSRWRVPSVNNAPEFYVFGDIKAVEHRVDGFLVRHVADDIGRVQRLGLVEAQTAALRYLSGITPPPDMEGQDRDLLVTWLGVRDRNQAGGAAGSRSFIANYLDSPEPLAMALTLTIVSHEQQHQLVDMVRGDRPPLPIWVGESLAQYYGLKAMARTGIDTKAAAAVRDRFIDRTRPVTAGLVEWQRRHENGDQSAYPRFYEQGATLWALLDTALLEATDGKQGLDAWMAELLASDFGAAGALPVDFVTRLRAVAGPLVDDLLARYVGT